MGMLSLKNKITITKSEFRQKKTTDLKKNQSSLNINNPFLKLIIKCSPLSLKKLLKKKKMRKYILVKARPKLKTRLKFYLHPAFFFKTYSIFKKKNYINVTKSISQKKLVSFFYFKKINLCFQNSTKINFFTTLLLFLPKNSFQLPHLFFFTTKRINRLSEFTFSNNKFTNITNRYY